MPRFAFALRHDPDRIEEWRAAVEGLQGAESSVHRMFLLDRGIYRERVWLQDGDGSPTLTLVLWDCDDIDVATKLASRDPTAHERWLVDTAIRGFHEVDGGPFALPEPELLSGTTTMATAAAGTQTMFALPLPVEAVPAVEALLDRIEAGDLADAHVGFLTEAAVREEWIWLQPAVHGLPPMLLVHWIADDLPAAWEALIEAGDDPYARVVDQALFAMLVGIPTTVVAGWDVEQVLAMHVRRSDSDDRRGNRVAGRLDAALARGRWEVLARICTPVVATDEGTAPPEAAVGRLRDLVGTAPWPVADTLVGRSQVLVVLDPPAPTADPRPAAVRFDLTDDGRVAGIRTIATWGSTPAPPPARAASPTIGPDGP